MSLFRKHWPWISVVSVFVIANVLVFVFTAERPPGKVAVPSGGAQSIDPRGLPVNRIGLAGEIASGTFVGPSMLSLEMRENVDFLLTPALIVQGAITEGDIVTYPEE
ncbi:MAG: hypothetical protein RLZZ326_2701 [Planctomycetota bacterium]|jgi:hypothetical protein